METKRELTGYAVRANPTGEVDFLASSVERARDGLIIEASAWQLENFRKNPILAWSHNYTLPPIGKVTSIDATDRGLLASARFDLEDEFARSIFHKYQNGFLSSFSVGFQILEQQGDRVTKSELLEVSGVPVPSDVNAVAAVVRSYRSLSTSQPLDFSGLSEDEIRELHRIIVREQEHDSRIKTIIAEEIGKWLQAR
jgi:HK97 family phage prohead protease